MRKIETRVQFLADEETKQALDDAVQELKHRGVKLPFDLNSPNRPTLGLLMREMVSRHLRDTIEEIAAEYGEPAPKRKRTRK